MDGSLLVFNKTPMCMPREHIDLQSLFICLDLNDIKGGVGRNFSVQVESGLVEQQIWVPLNSQPHAFELDIFC